MILKLARFIKLLSLFLLLLFLLSLVPLVRENIEALKKAEKEVNRREKPLQVYLEGRNLAKHDIDCETNAEYLFQCIFKKSAFYWNQM